ncbi:hypothetical protein HRbin15_00179 [bacterium HR15]|nr:hypothetical protein HRbin15_00179 [bacterium HR15]
MQSQWRAYLVGLAALLLIASFYGQAGVRSYLVRRLYETGMRQKFNAVYNLKGDVRSSLFEGNFPIHIDAQLEINTQILSVNENGQARMRYSFRYLKQVVDFFAEEELPEPFTATIRVTPSGFPAEDETTSKFRKSRQEEEEKGAPGIDFLPDLLFFLQLVGLDVVPGPFSPMPPGAVREGDQWKIGYPTPFLNTRGGRLSLGQATVHTYPATVKVIGMKEIKGRPVLHVQQVTDTEIDIPLDDTLLEIVRLRDRNPPRGRIKGAIKGTTDFYYALADGALLQASGYVRQKLRAEYDPQTIKEWEPEEHWAEWEIQATFRQVLAEEKVTPAKSGASKPNRSRSRK